MRLAQVMILIKQGGDGCYITILETKLKDLGRK